MVSLVVHGGAGRFEAARQQPALDGIRRACEIGWALLSQGASALDVVERVVTLLEDDPTFDAGTGSYPNFDSFIETAAIGTVQANQQVALASFSVHRANEGQSDV